MKKTNLNDKYKKQVDKAHYDFDRYLSLERWITYYYQTREVLSVAKALKRKSIKVLEIGIGDKTASSVLKAQGMDVVTMDIDPELKPDYVSALPQINLPKKYKFDCILCCEVLEHAQYEDVERSLVAMAQRAEYCVISVPHKGITLSFAVKPWFYKTRKLSLSIPTSFRSHKFDGEHYWELGARGFSAARLRETIKQAGFQCINDYRIPELPWTHFFIIKGSKL